ncbi:MAG: lipocalin family protein [Granulicella sp.]
MTKQALRTTAKGLALLSLLLALAQVSSGQTVRPVPKLDLTRFTGAWYIVARQPNKREKDCVSDSFVEIALADKPNRFQLVNACRVKTGEMVANNASGKQNKNGDGKLRASYLWPFSTKYWVLALGPEYAWALVGSPNHKNLWVFSRTTALPPEVLSEIEAQAVSQGFDTSKLVSQPQENIFKP